MASLNKHILIGNLGKDPEVRSMPSGELVANFNLATSYKYKDRAGNQQEETEWHRVSVFGKQAELAQKFCKTGSCVYVEGRSKLRKFTSKDGQEKTYVEVIATTFILLPGKHDIEKNVDKTQKQEIANSFDDDIPF